MRTLGQHIECLEELDRDAERRSRPPPRARTLGLIVGATLTALAIGGACLLEEMALERWRSP